MNFLIKYGRLYENEFETMTRFGIFLANKAKIEAHNQKKLNWTLDMNQFGDYT
jgi:hypothetical protein